MTMAPVTCFPLLESLELTASVDLTGTFARLGCRLGGVGGLDWAAPTGIRVGGQDSSHFQFCFVQLRFRIADGALQQPGDFMMRVTFHFVQCKNPPTAGRQAKQGAPQSDAIDDSGKVGIVLANVNLEIWTFRVNWIHQGNRGQRFATAKIHQDRIDGYAVEPSREGSVASE